MLGPDSAESDPAGGAGWWTAAIRAADGDVVDAADLVDGAAQVGFPGRAGRGVAEQRQPVGDRAFVITGQIARHRQEIAGAGFPGIDGDGLFEILERFGGASDHGRWPSPGPRRAPTRSPHGWVPAPPRVS